MKKNILVVEDEARLSEVICKYLSSEGFNYTQAYLGREGIKLFEAQDPDLVILDIMLPDINGLDVCEKIRASSDVPIIFLTAKVDDKDRLAGFSKGADDYVCKPFNPQELVSRIHAIIRRCNYVPGQGMIIRGPITMLPIEKRVRVNGEEIELTPSEFNLLKAMMINPTKVFSRKELLTYAQGKYSEFYERTVDSHIKNLRKKITQAGANNYIKTVYGSGYKFC